MAITTNRVRHFRELIVWQRSIELSLAIYALTKDFPREEIYGLTIQMRRAAVSILSNLAEGHGRSSRVQLANFVSIEKGACYELEAQLYLVKELGYEKAENHLSSQSLCDEVGRMLHAMLAKLQMPQIEPRT